MRAQNRSSAFLSAVTYALTLVVGLCLGYLLFGRQATPLPWRDFSADKKVDEILGIVKKRYVDSLNTDTLEKKAIGKLLEELDPHSTYLPPSTARLMNESLEGNFEGIGIEYHPLGDSLMVVTRVVPDGPAAQAGMQQGDHVTEIQGHRLNRKDIDRDRIAGLLKGQRGSHVALRVYRPSLKQEKRLMITRAKVNFGSLDAAYMIGKENGYVKLNRFSSSTDADFQRAVFTLKKSGMKNLVLDLRGNGGGYLSSATALADEFLPAKKLIVFTKGAHEPRMDYFATDSGCFQQGKLVVLIDEYSASASEIFAGAMQDLDRATIIGRRSFGKGLVQEQFAFDDGSALNLTIARYYTPSGRSIQKSYRNGTADYRQELARRGRNGELFAENSVLPLSQAAFHTQKGRPVYGGGGITPDVFIPEDTTGQTPLFARLNSRNVLMDFVVGSLAPQGSPGTKLDVFIRDYALSDTDFARFVNNARNVLGEVPADQLDASAPLIRKTIKALLARYYWGDEGLYRVLNADDPALTSAVKYL